MCNDPSPMSKSKTIVIKILGPDGKWKTLKTDSVTKGTKKLKKNLRRNSRRQQQESFRWFGGWERSNLTRFLPCWCLLH